MKLSLEIKQKLYRKCMDVIDEKIDHVHQRMDEVQAASNLETKSSAGDKYETTRAMMHIEKEKHGLQLEENKNLKRQLSELNVESAHTEIQPGSLLSTSEGNYFLGISLGELVMEGTTWTTLSLASPLGKSFFKKKTGDEYDFRGKTWKILEII